MATHGIPPHHKTERQPPAGGEAAAVRNSASARRLRRRLRALKATIYVLVAGCLCAIGLAIGQVAHQPVLAGVYVGLASVGVAGMGVCVTVYLHIRRKDGSASDDAT
jgi:drug/metabolite transporter (DMT)-like permease